MERLRGVEQWIFFRG